MSPVLFRCLPHPRGAEPRGADAGAGAGIGSLAPTSGGGPGPGPGPGDRPASRIAPGTGCAQKVVMRGEDGGVVEEMAGDLCTAGRL
jgi:hypothetical protein